MLRAGVHPLTLELCIRKHIPRLIWGQRQAEAPERSWDLHSLVPVATT